MMDSGNRKMDLRNTSHGMCKGPASRTFSISTAVFTSLMQGLNSRNSHGAIRGLHSSTKFEKPLKQIASLFSWLKAVMIPSSTGFNTADFLTGLTEALPKSAVACSYSDFRLEKQMNTS